MYFVFRGAGYAWGVDEELKKIARTLVWWKPPEEVEFLYLVRRVMNDGTMAMQRTLVSRFREDVFREALAGAEMGELSPRAWNYWHIRLGIDPIPPLPTREVPDSPYVSPEIVRAARPPTRALAAPWGGS